MMQLQYHRGKNFGDQLNPFIFHHFLPGYFEENGEGVHFLGIGSILGFAQKYVGKKIVFSSGFGDGAKSTYGSLPEDWSSFDIISVRGPLTAALIGLDDDHWVTDGAILLAGMPLQIQARPKQISFMPHLGSEAFYDHELLCRQLGWQFISPSESVEVVLEKIANSSFLVTEAMHGAIVADTLRVPWIPYVGFGTINSFKWKDWCASMELSYSPHFLKPFYSDEKLGELIELKWKLKSGGILHRLVWSLGKWRMRQNWRNNKALLKEIAIKENTYLSEDSLFEKRLSQMMSKIEYLKKKYPLRDGIEE